VFSNCPDLIFGKSGSKEKEGEIKFTFNLKH
jgi:hypothetical protein